MTEKGESYYNLLDFIVQLNEYPELQTSASEMFRRLLRDYFFKRESEENKNLEQMMEDFAVPENIASLNSLFDIDIMNFSVYVDGETINDSLAGTIMLSPQYLKVFYPDHPSSFSKLPEDIKYTLVDRIKEKNALIVSAFEKMLEDREADRNRTVLTMVALILKNIHLKSGRPFNRLEKTAQEIISSLFTTSDEVFIAKERQVSEVGDDSRVKELVKTFFIIRQFKEITEITEMFMEELERYRKRAIMLKGA